jgi:hypothetical protein
MVRGQTDTGSSDRATRRTRAKVGATSMMERPVCRLYPAAIRSLYSMAPPVGLATVRVPALPAGSGAVLAALVVGREDPSDLLVNARRGTLCKTVMSVTSATI